MPSELPYLVSYKNVEALFQKIAAAKQPEAFTTKFLSETLGLTSSSDRPLIALLRTLGFIDAAGRTQPSYAKLKNPTLSGGAIAAAIRKAYAPLFAANENANELQGQELKGLIAQVAGTDTGMTDKIAWTFRALVKVGDFEAAVVEEGSDGGGEKAEVNGDGDETSGVVTQERPDKAKSGLRPEFHYNIQVHLPANGSEETYLNIFNAIRKTFR